MSNYRHAEAFALMLYRNDKTKREEWLWNSRDGVTPFVIPDGEDGGRMQYVDFWRDARVPFYVPPVGSRIFVDLTETRARYLAARIYDECIDDPGFREHLTRYGAATRDAFIEKRSRHILDYGGGGGPDVLVVNAAMQDEFRARRPAIPFGQKLRFA